VREVVSGGYEGSATGFYVTSWLLAHYLMLNTADDAIDSARTREYLALYDAGVDPIEAFEQGFGMTPVEMQRKTRRYVTRSRIGGLQSAGIEYSGEIVQRRMDEGESLFLIGDIAVERNRHDAAYHYLDEFDALEFVAMDRRKADSRRAIALIHDNRLSEGDRLIDELLATDPDDPDLLADIAHYAIDRYLREPDESNQRDERDLSRSIEFGERAVSANPTDLEALYYLGLAYESASDLQKAADTLLRSYDINPSVPRLNENLARVLIKGRQPELAAYLLRRLYSATHNTEQRVKLLAIIEEIEDGDYDADAIAAQL
jgi:tetratricopeptide (TPR) repeat protein